jgi:hypothetical protein
MHKNFQDTDVTQIHKRYDEIMIYLGHIACRPPSTGKEAPVMKLALSLAKKRIAFASSSTFPGRPRA